MRRLAFVAATALALARSARADEAPPDWVKYVRVTGYIQPQFVASVYDAGASPNADSSGNLPAGVGPNDVIALPDGRTTNTTYFRLRRARLKAEVSPTDYAHVTLEIEPLVKGGSVLGTGTIARTVEAVGIARFAKGRYLELAAGQFNVPFGGEVMEANAERPFIDSSFHAGALFPGDFDVGARATLALDGLTLMSSILNGVMIGEKDFATLPDFNRGKDLTLRADYDFGPLDVGASGYVGSGQLVDPSKLAFKQYGRWALNAEATLHTTFARVLGTTKVFATLTYATNLDRGTSTSFALPDLPADLSRAVTDKHELGWMVRAEQDVTGRFTFGVRYDVYSPDVSLADDARSTLSSVLAIHFTKKLQAMLEWDAAFDHTHATASAPTRQVTDTFSGVLQARY